LKTVSINDKKNITLTLKLVQNMLIPDASVWLFEVSNAALSLNLAASWYLKRMYGHSQKKGVSFIPNFSFAHYKKIVAMFANPKKTHLISLKSETAYNHFPIDLCAQILTYNFIGIRNSNHYSATLKINDEFFISTAASENYKEIYKLGKFKNDNFNESSNKEQTLNEILPNVICEYKKVKLIDKIILEHQTIYIAKTIESVSLNNGKRPLFHLHKIWLLHLNTFNKIELIQS